MDIKEAVGLKEVLSYYKRLAEKRKKGDLLKEYIQKWNEDRKEGTQYFTQEKIAEYLDISIQTLRRMLASENRKFEENGEYEKELEELLSLKPGSFDLEKDQLRQGYAADMRQEKPDITDTEITASWCEGDDQREYAFVEGRQLKAIGDWCDRLELESCCLLAVYMEDFLNIPQECRIFLGVYIYLEEEERRSIRKKMQEFHISVSDVYDRLPYIESLMRLTRLEKSDIRKVLAEDKKNKGQSGKGTQDREEKVREQYKQTILDGLKGQSYDAIEWFYQWFWAYPEITRDEWEAMGEFNLLNSRYAMSSRYPRYNISTYQAGLLDEIRDKLEWKMKERQVTDKGREARDKTASGGNELTWDTEMQCYIRICDREEPKEEGPYVQPD